MDNTNSPPNNGQVKNTPSHQAAMYVRMSTDHQKYSTQNQADAIKKYANEKQYSIIKTYEDNGKSGLSVSGRAAFQQLIHDVESEQTPFRHILVYDITRWGRFQDTDASAYYEHLCKKAGIQIHYVAEQFVNDGSSVSNLVKTLKREMAKEYSRELSQKVFRGQCRLIQLGFRQGGFAGFGLRRMLIDEQGNQKGILKNGEHKSIQTDRVILVPGPNNEIKWVHWIYQQFIKHQKSEKDIATELNRLGIKTDLNKKWTYSSVHQILTNEKYIGNNVFNRQSYKLKKQRIRNPPDKWIRANAVFTAIIDPDDFYRVQQIIKNRRPIYTDQQLLNKLKALYRNHGWISGIIINEHKDIPSSHTYAHRFGGLIRAYRLVGYTPMRDYRYLQINKRIRKIYQSMISGVIKTLIKSGTTVSQHPSRDQLSINDELTVAITVCRCFYTKAGALRWKIRLNRCLNTDFTLAIRMNFDNTDILDYYLLPTLDIDIPHIRLAEHQPDILDAYRYDNLDIFFSLTQRTQIQEAS